MGISLASFGFPMFSTAYVVASNAPAVTRYMARVAKVVMGNLIQICDGTADDVEIQAAINALPAAGGVVQLSEGTFSLAASIIPRSYLHLQGTGAGLEVQGPTILVPATNMNASVIRNNTGADMIEVLFSDFTIDGNKANQGAGSWHGIDLSRIQAQCRSLYIASCKSAGIYGDNSLAAQRFEILFNVKVDSCDGVGIRLLACDGSVLDWVVVDACGSHGFHLGGAWGTLLVASHLFAGLNAGRGIYITTIGWVYGEDWWAEQNAQRGIMLETITRGHFAHLFATGNGTTPEPGQDHQISILAPNGVSVHGLDIYSTAVGKYGLVVVTAGGRNLFIFGGRIELTGAGTTGIYLGGDATNGQYRIKGVAIQQAVTPITVEAAIDDRCVVEDCPGINPRGIAAIAVGGSPFTYTNEDYVDEEVYIRVGTVSDISRGGTTIFVATPATVKLRPGESVVVTYTVIPTMVKYMY